jgi:hypothetical protein
MHRSIWLAALALAACGTDNDQRPRTVQYITEAILAPNCGNAQCHSSFSNTFGYAFDTVKTAQQSLVIGGLVGAISLNARDEPEGDASSSFLINVLTRTVKRMPYDQPLLEADIDLISRWIDFGAPGAQCDPSANNGMVCVDSKSVECLKTYDYGAVVKDCATTNQSCSRGVCL